MTVNHDVAGSSPAGGAKKRRGTQRVPFLFFSFLVRPKPSTPGSKQTEALALSDLIMMSRKAEA